MQPREDLANLIGIAMNVAIASGELPLEKAPEVALERPRDDDHGDWACTVALRCAKQAHKNPRDIAQAIQMDAARDDDGDERHARAHQDAVHADGGPSEPGRIGSL